MARIIPDIFRKAVLDAGISGKNWRKVEAFDDFTSFYETTYNEEQRKSMKYETILKISKEWWDVHHGKYS